MKNSEMNDIKCIHAHMDKNELLSTDVVETDDKYVCTLCGKEFSYDEYAAIMLYFGHTEVIGIYGKL